VAAKLLADFLAELESGLEAKLLAACQTVSILPCGAAGLVVNEHAARLVKKAVTGTGAAQAVALVADDLGTGASKLLDGNIKVIAVATDAAGNAHRNDPDAGHPAAASGRDPQRWRRADPLRQEHRDAA
jgi:hypothetical protein